MNLKIQVQLHYRFTQPTDIILQLEASKTDGQSILTSAIDFDGNIAARKVAAESDIGTRSLFYADGDFICHYHAQVEISRSDIDLTTLNASPLSSLDAQPVRYLFPSSYCATDQLNNFIYAEFGTLSGGSLIQAMANWIYQNLTYMPVSNSRTTAMDTFAQRQGICRDYAHLLITMARTAGIPARMASVYAPLVDPRDFHAAVQVFLDGEWHLIDATQMATPSDMAIIGVGMDAAEIAFMTSFNDAQFVSQSVNVEAS